MPVPTRPKMEVSPDTPRIPAAAILATPWSMAWLTRWKRGPECAAQQQKCVSAIAQNGQMLHGEPLPETRTGDQAVDGCPPLGECGGHFWAPALDKLEDLDGNADDDCGPFKSIAQGSTTTHARFPSTMNATRQSNSLISQRLRGASARMP